MSLVILGALLLEALAGLGLIAAALAKAAAWGWRPALARRDGKWPTPRKLLAAGIVLLALALLQAVAIVTYISLVVATSYAQ